MPHTWKHALDQYRYPVDLRKFTGAQEHQRWFELNTSPGDPLRTIAFETRFREQARHRLEAWGEVVFWKLYTMPLARDKTTRNVLSSSVAAGELWSRCIEYVENPGRVTFRAFRQKLFTAPVVATTATFPAFICPEKFPMVDTQITRWAVENGDRHGYAADGGPDLECVPVLRSGEVLQERHWPFVESWIAWCGFSAWKLSQVPGPTWRSRDVEMAVFTAQKCGLPLTPLTSSCMGAPLTFLPSAQGQLR